MKGRGTHNVDNLVILGAVVCSKVVGKPFCIFGNVRPLRGIEVVDHTFVEGEDGRCRTNLCAHVTDSRHTGARKRFDARTLILHDGSGSTLDSENSGDLQDDIY
jgi:hypothetical protein